MYERFFGLDELPFQLTPDPRYLFLSSKHREALGHLVYGVREGAGFVCITGEIGAGKTTLLRALLREADASTQYAYILNPVLTGVELLQEINHELGIRAEGTRRELLSALNQALLDQKALGRRVVLVIDEAQALDGAILEQLRLLSNFETETAKLLQIVLVGQPELRDILARPDLEQLNQRITVRWHLGPLDRAETAQYIAHRVRTAGQTRSLFSPGAIGLVHTYSRGIPRLINVVCHRALLVAFASDRAKVSRTIVRRAIAELRRHLPARPLRPTRHAPLVAAAAAAAASVALVVGGFLVWQRLGPGRPLDAVATADSSSATAAKEAKAAAEPSRAESEHALAAADSKEPPGGAPSGKASGAISSTAPAAPPVSAPAAAAPAPTAPTQAATAPNAPDQVVAAPAAPPQVPVASSSAPADAASDASPPGGKPAAPPVEVASSGGAPPPAGGPGTGAARDSAADPLAVERETLAEALRQTTAGNSAYEATESLLRAWGVAPLTPQEAARPTLDLQSIGRARGLEYLALSGNLNLLRVLDLPAILEIAPEDGSPSRFVTVSRLDDDVSHVVVGRSEVDVSPAVLADAWFGKAHLFWRDLDRFGGLLAVGVVNPKVKRLHTLLRGVGVYNGPDSAVFDAGTEEAVMRFQRAKRLFADGKAGPMTMITLYQSVADDRVPRLGESPRSSPSHSARADDARIGMGGGWN